MSGNIPCPDNCVAHRELETRVTLIERDTQSLFRKLDRLTWWAIGLMGALTLDILLRFAALAGDTTHMIIRK